MLLDLFDSYSEYLRPIRSQRTRYGYVARARAFVKTLTTDSEFTETAVRLYISRMGDRCRPSSQCSALAAIRSFAEWLVECGHIPANPTDKIKAPKLDAPHRETPTEAQVEQMMDACDRIRHPYRRALATAVVYTFAMSAVRRSELIALRTGDIDLKEGAIYVRHGKGDKARTVRPGEACMEALSHYLCLRAAVEDDRLWMVRKGYLMGDEGLRTLLRDVAAIAGLRDVDAILPHGMRHACATRLLRNGADIEDVREFLGHSDVGTTQIYLHSPTDRMREVAKLTDPRKRKDAPPPPSPPDPPSARADRPTLRLISGDQA